MSAQTPYPKARLHVCARRAEKRYDAKKIPWYKIGTYELEENSYPASKLAEPCK